MVCRSVGHELKIVRLVLIVTRDVEGHHSLKENLRRRVIAEKSIAGDIVEFALGRVGAALHRTLGDDRSVQAEESIQPFLDFITSRVTNRSFQFNLPKGASLRGGLMRGLFGGRSRSGRLVRWCFLREGGTSGFSELLNEFQRERTTGALVTIDRGGHEHEVRTDEVPDEGKWYRGGFVNNHEFSLAEHVCVLRLYVLPCDQKP